MKFEEFLTAAASVRPSARQLAWYDTEFYAFVHFTVNTYTDLEWGLGNEPESIFNPYDLDCDEWVSAIKSAGMKGLVLTAKHHDGFCLWPSQYTEHSVKNSPWKNGKGDVVRECAEACKRGGIKFGVYLSPWDRNSEFYGTPEYNDYYCNQLTELLTNYGELFMVWFDGACGEGPNGKKQEYDFDRYIALIRKYQPNAAIFNDHGPDVRWCGNEAGSARAAEWAVMPSELCWHAEVQTGAGPLAGKLDFLYNPDPELGSLPNILYSKGLTFTGAEIDMSIRKGWFWHKEQEPHSVERLFNTYVNSCGANTSFNLNIPPMPSGRFDPRDIARLKEFGDALKSAFGDEKSVETQVERVPVSETQVKYEIKLDKPEIPAWLDLAEDITKGQRVEAFRIYAGDRVLYRGTTIGHRKLCKIEGYPGEELPAFDRLTVFITAARGEVSLKEPKVYRA